ncbi:alpha-glucosidase [Agarivorans sp. 1_MG-2023]|uniref:glycoside hydrolase family 13 protein n=1 Tax=Agarivorans sp. 1_MG-2023 TaxID=3062634 RepID=UPI0026E22CC2|nr:alpha-glucosidase [Agarivorans sp. 1_MG-2023]MDO6763291.1 alpha-glucosidase [Agarivorans sp. 1_MG-2023]
MEKQWWHSAVVYQIYPRSFCDSSGDGNGDLRGINSKLPYLEKLGIDLIWLSPVYLSPMKDNGYDIADYQAIDPRFGSMADMQTLIHTAKQHNIGIMMDLVLNHTSDQHQWFQQAKQSRDNPYRDYYIWRDQPNQIRSIFSGPAWQFDNTTKQYYFHLFADAQPDLNWENPKVATEIQQMISWWVEQGVAGFRLDVIDLIGKQIDQGITENGPRLHPLLQQMHQACFANKPLVTVGETWGATPEIAKLYSNPQRQELSMVFQFEHASIDWHPIHGKWQVQPFDLIELKAVMSKWQTCFDGDGWNALFWNNHDLPRIVSRWGNDGQYRERSAKLLATLLHGMQGTPYIYQGEEIAMTNVRFEDLDDYDDIEIKNSYQEKVLEQQSLSHQQFMQGVYTSARDNARTPMQWDNSVNAGFTHGKPWLALNPNYSDINVANALDRADSVFYHYQQLIALRKSAEYSDTLIYGDFALLLAEHPQVFAYVRQHQQQRLLVMANVSEQEQQVGLNLSVEKVVLNNLQQNDELVSDLEALRLAPYQAIVYALSTS